MKALKIGIITLCSILATLYLIFLFAVPAFVKIDDYTYELKDNDNQNQGLIVKAEKIKILTSWNLAAGAKIGQINAFYKDGRKFAQIDDLNATISLPHLLIKQIKLDKISTEKLITRLGVESNGVFEIEKFIPKNESQSTQTAELPFGLKISDNMPVISAKKYSITFIDNSNKKHYSIKGKDFKISDFNLKKKVSIKAVGKIKLDNQEQFNYDLDLTSHVMPEFTASSEQNTQGERFNILTIFRNLYKLNLTANASAKVKLSGAIDDIKTFGTVNISNLSVKVQGQQLPASTMNLDMSGNNIKITSNLHTGLNEHALINGQFKYGKKQNIDLNVKSEKLQLKSIFSIVNAMLPLAGIDDINGIQANGLVKANFNIKSDFKTINSDGYLKITDANIFYNIFNIALKNINADIDFSGNKIEIRQANADFNGAPLSLKGVINSNAYANLSILADKIPLKGVFVALGQLKLLDENNIKSGIVTLNGTVKGKLDTVKPLINVSLDNINIYNKPTKASIILNNAKAEAQTSGAKTNGIVLVKGLKLIMSGLPTFSIPDSKISFDEKNINFDKAYVNLNNSTINILGQVKDYTSEKMNIDITAEGMLGAVDIKNSLDKSLQNTVKAVGRLPIAIRITGDSKVQNINGQLMANNTNHLSIVDINSLAGKTSLINTSMVIENNALKINDISINAHSVNKGLTDNFKNNLSGSTKVVLAKGTITNLSGKTQQISGLNISIPQQVTVSIPTLKNSKASLKGDINVSGTTANPVITGIINIPSVSIPTFDLTGKNISINATKNLIDIYCNQLDIADSSMNIVTTLNSNFNKGIYIKSLDFNAQNINADTLTQMLANMPQNAAAPGTNTGITIASGKAKVERLSSGTIVATNLASDFNMYNNLFKMDNITGIAYGGKLAGKVHYNMLYSSTDITMQGRGLNALSATYATTGINNLMTGTLDFDAMNITTRGLTEQQIMQSLKGDVGFIVSDGQMGTLGKLENFLYAQNILTNNLLKTSMGAVVGAVKIKKTGDFKYIKGKVKLANGWANLDNIQTSGPAMSMNIQGKYSYLTNFADMKILGRVSDEVVDVLGPLGTFSVNSLIASIPKIGAVTSSLINQMTTNPSGENLSMLPELTPLQENTKEFKVIIDGNVESTSSVKSFKWLATPTADTTGSTTTSSVQQQAQQAVDTIKNNTQNMINKVIKIQPTTQNNAPTSNGVADFINKLPNLSK